MTRRPVLPRRRAPEVVHPQEAALEQILAQPQHFDVAEAHRAHVGRHGVGAIEERVVGEPDHVVVGPLAGILADGRPRQLREPDQQVVVAVGIVGLPAGARVLASDALIHDPADRKGAVGKLWRRHADPDAAEAELRRHQRRRRHHAAHERRDSNQPPGCACGRAAWARYRATTRRAAARAGGTRRHHASPATNPATCAQNAMPPDMPASGESAAEPRPLRNCSRNHSPRKTRPESRPAG